MKCVDLKKVLREKTELQVQISIEKSDKFIIFSKKLYDQQCQTFQKKKEKDAKSW